MPDYSDIERVFQAVNEAREREAKQTGFPVMPVGDDEKQEAYRWVDGQEIRNVIDTTGVQTILAKLEKYMDDVIRELLLTSPADEKAVLALHADAYSKHNTRERLLTDIQNDLAAAEVMPDIIKQGTRIFRGMATTPVSEDNK